eukprot:3497273-Rhodomonas_salina.1
MHAFRCGQVRSGAVRRSAMMQPEEVHAAQRAHHARQRADAPSLSASAHEARLMHIMSCARTAPGLGDDDDHGTNRVQMHTLKCVCTHAHAHRAPCAGTHTRHGTTELRARLYLQFVLVLIRELLYQPLVALYEQRVLLVPGSESARPNQFHVLPLRTLCTRNAVDPAAECTPARSLAAYARVV